MKKETLFVLTKIESLCHDKAIGYEIIGSVDWIYEPQGWDIIWDNEVFQIETGKHYIEDDKLTQVLFLHARYWSGKVKPRIPLSVLNELSPERIKEVESTSIMESIMNGMNVGSKTFWGCEHKQESERGGISKAWLYDENGNTHLINVDPIDGVKMEEIGGEKVITEIDTGMGFNLNLKREYVESDYVENLKKEVNETKLRKEIEEWLNDFSFNKLNEIVLEPEMAKLADELNYTYSVDGEKFLFRCLFPDWILPDVIKMIF